MNTTEDISYLLFLLEILLKREINMSKIMVKEYVKGAFSNGKTAILKNNIQERIR